MPNKTTITKGSITMLDTTERRDFMFNPTTISDKKGFTWVKTQVPHISHPVYQAGSGSERPISFELYLDGDRGRSLTGGQGGRVPYDKGLDVRDEIEWYRSLVYPASLEDRVDRSGLGTQPQYYIAKAPRKVIFNYGTFWREVICVVTSVDLNAQMFTPAGEIVRATLSITLEEAPNSPQFASDVFAPWRG